MDNGIQKAEILPQFVVVELAPKGGQVVPAWRGQRPADEFNRLRSAQIGETEALCQGPPGKRAVDEPGIEDVACTGGVQGVHRYRLGPEGLRAARGHG